MIDWIPVSDWLPEESGAFLVSLYSQILDSYDVEMLYYDDKNGFHFYDSEYGDVPVRSVIAWAPLPEPYKEEEQ